MIVDVHNMSVKEAVEHIRFEIKKAYNLSITQIEIIHGFNNGIEIKKRLLNLKDPLIVSITPKPLNSGSTLINLKMKIF